MKLFDHALRVLLTTILCTLTFSMSLASKQSDSQLLPQMAEQTLDSVQKYFRTSDPSLLLESFPKRSDQKKCSYLWGYSAMISSVSALYENTGDAKWEKLMAEVMLPGLDQYYDNQREPAGYASYLVNDGSGDRFYDDNIWLGIDMTDMYVKSGKKGYLDRALEIWKFVMSGYDQKLEGGIYWCEQKKESKNTCSNAPAAVFALKLFQATKQRAFLKQGQNLYEWTKKNLEDTTDNLYFDNKSLSGKIQTHKFSYNAGQMLQAATLLFQLTKNKQYLHQAQNLAEACYKEFFTSKGQNHNNLVLKGGEKWFDAVMLRGFLQLYQVSKDDKYLSAFKCTIFTAWHELHSEDKGLFNNNLLSQQPRYADNARNPKQSKSLLTQAAFIEMMARLSNY